MSRFGDARAELWDALSTVLPGRVFAYPPASPAQVATPAVWIDGHTGFLDDAIYVTRWQVVAVADGADRAQLDILDDVTSAVWSSIMGAAPFALEDHTSTTHAVSDDVTLHAVNFTVTVLVAAASFCPAVPESATIPTTRTEVAHV